MKAPRGKILVMIDSFHCFLVIVVYHYHILIILRFFTGPFKGGFSQLLEQQFTKIDVDASSPMETHYGQILFKSSNISIDKLISKITK